MKYLAQKTPANTKITVHFEPGLFIMMIISMLKMLKILKILNSIPKHMVPTDTLFKIIVEVWYRCIHRFNNHVSFQSDKPACMHFFL